MAFGTFDTFMGLLFILLLLIGLRFYGFAISYSIVYFVMIPMVI